MRRIGHLIRRVVPAVIAIGALALILIWMAGGFHDKIEPGTVESPLRRHGDEPTATVQLVNEPIDEVAVGTIAALHRTEVSPRITARIEEVNVRAGDMVAQGDVLAVLDSRDLQSRVAQARETVTSVEANAARAQADLARFSGLLEQGVVDQAEFDQVQSSARMANAEVERARRAAEEAEVALTYAEVTAPISGRIVDRLAEPGDLTVPGVPIVTLYNPESLRLEAAVREGLATQLRVGDPLRIHVDTLELDLMGSVEEIVPQAETGSRSFLVKVRLPHAEGLYTGMFGRLMIPAGERQRLCVPAAGLIQVGQLNFAEVVGDDDLIERRLVQIGEQRRLRDGALHIEVLSGLASGERVVIAN